MGVDVLALVLLPSLHPSPPNKELLRHTTPEQTHTHTHTLLSARIMASLLKSRLSHASSNCSLTSLESALASFRISPAVCTNSRIPTGRRNASHQAQGRANGAKDGPGKRLGAKKSGGQYVVPGNILFRQRGTLWFPGDNCYMV